MSRKKHGYNRARVKHLWNTNPNCYWCGIETVIQDSGASVANSNTATFDHLYHKSESQRWTKEGRHAGVLSCYQCNINRGREAFIKTLPKINQWMIKSGLHVPVYHLKKGLYRLYRKLTNQRVA